MSDSVRPHRWQPTRLSRPWDSPGKNIGVGCHFLLQCVKVKSESEVAQSCPTLSDPMDGSLPGFSVHGIFQARVLEWGSGLPLPSPLTVLRGIKKKKNSPFICLFILPALCSMWYLSSQPGIEPTLPAVEAWSQPTGPPGKSLERNLKTNLFTPEKHN